MLGKTVEYVVLEDSKCLIFTAYFLCMVWCTKGKSFFLSKFEENIWVGFNFFYCQIEKCSKNAPISGSPEHVSIPAVIGQNAQHDEDSNEEEEHQWSPPHQISHLGCVFILLNLIIWLNLQTLCIDFNITSGPFSFYNYIQKLYCFINVCWSTSVRSSPIFVQK